jgi:hypothetical protein
MDATPRFDRGSVGAFRIAGRAYDARTRTAVLGYEFDTGQRFEEVITFETEPSAVGTDLGPGFERALLHLHIAAGTSYYKAAAPPVVELVGDTLTPAEREFHQLLYDSGLREFAVTNGLAVPRDVDLRSAAPAAEARSTGPLPSSGHPPGPSMHPGGLVVPIGGGKDSLVLIEAVRSLRPRLLAVNPHPLTVALAGQAGLELLTVRRILSPNLAALNQSGALNGHVPITAIISLVAVAGSFLYGYDSIAMAIERSASEETRWVDGVPVNHQYSKSLAFEHALVDLVGGSIDPGLTYGSALRPYSELAIARAFSTIERYHSTFCSCNAAFRSQADPSDRWCGHCPKCRFVGLMLAPFMTRDAVEAIIGADLFGDPDQVRGFAALMSDDDKPFECVGERRESAVALRLLAAHPAWRDSVVVAELAGLASSLVSDADLTDVLTSAAGLDHPDPAVAAAVTAMFAPRS